jgi:signal transduction histidine kinase
MEFATSTADSLGRQSSPLVRSGCMLMIAAAGMRAAFTAAFEAERLDLVDYWAIQWSVGYILFIVAYVLDSRSQTATRWRNPLLLLQGASALYLVWLYPSFLITTLLVVVAWQIAWSMSLRRALGAVATLSIALAAMKCTDQADSMSLLVLVSTCGFALFAVSAAHLARCEASARQSLMKVNAELRATQALLAESTRMAERLRISRDLHDVLGHNLTSMAVHLDVASRLAHGACVEHVHCARQVAGTLLGQVREVVGQIRVQPVDLRETLRCLTQGLVGLNVKLRLPENLTAIDPARADALLRCTQELITNTLRHAQASELFIEIQQASDGCVSIAARDDGRGGEIVEGYGLAGMHERFRSLGGTLSVTSAPSQGFRIQGRLPVLDGAA